MEVVIVVFLLMFAMLAFAWFYLQRAKARTDASVASSDAAAATDAAAPAATAPADDHVHTADDEHDHPH
jgi:Flp pilus assembly protein TadB